MFLSSFASTEFANFFVPKDEIGKKKFSICRISELLLGLQKRKKLEEEAPRRIRSVREARSNFVNLGQISGWGGGGVGHGNMPF